MMKYLEGEELTQEEIIKALDSNYCVKIIPEFVSVFKNKGVQLLLDAVINYAPSPLDVPPVHGIIPDNDEWFVKADDNEPFVALVLK